MTLCFSSVIRRKYSVREWKLNKFDAGLGWILPLNPLQGADGSAKPAHIVCGLIQFAILSLVCAISIGLLASTSVNLRFKK